MLSTQRNRRLVFVCGFFAVIITGALAAGQAQAVVPSPVAFELLFSPSARVLGAYDTPEYYEVKYDESCDNPHLRIRARNKPAILLENSDTSDAPISAFTLKINNAGPYVFGTGDVGTDNFDNFIKNTIYTDSGVLITGSSVSPDAKTLTVNFSGLDAGKKAIFNIDLDTTDPNAFMFPDYRAVFFGVGNPAPPTGTVTTTFTNNTAAPNSKTLTLELDPYTKAIEYMEEEIRPYQNEDKMEVIKDGGQVPEPAGIVLALAGFAALAIRRRAA